MADAAAHDQWSRWLRDTETYLSAVRQLIDGDVLDPGELPAVPASAVPPDLQPLVALRRVQAESVLADGERARAQLRARMERQSAYDDAVTPRDLGVL